MGHDTESSADMRFCLRHPGDSPLEVGPIASLEATYRDVARSTSRDLVRRIATHIHDHLKIGNVYVLTVEELSRHTVEGRYVSDTVANYSFLATEPMQNKHAFEQAVSTLIAAWRHAE